MVNSDHKICINILLTIALGWCAVLQGQSSGTLSGNVRDAGQNLLSGAAVTLSQPLTGFSRTVESDGEGAFTFANLPLQTYILNAIHPSFSAARRTVTLRSNIPLTLNLVLEVAARSESVDVVAESGGAVVDSEATGTRQTLNRSAIDHLQVPVNNRGLEALLLNFPGFAANANGAIHPRGAHNQMTYVIDGMPVSDQLTGAFASSLGVDAIETVELFTSNIPAEYGNKTAAVVNLTTRSGLGTGRKFEGSTELNAARFETAGQVTQFSGGGDRWGYFTSLTSLKSHRYLDQVSLDNLHNGGNLGRA
ncbi:MAG: carboxypeptidase regulatory-like domain-containing protein, partial [Bryobacteraceae bacterium]|nr:carboxypeptidase regulatory-like domain-containing protein [Bryobacteraceae bacterium]